MNKRFIALAILAVALGAGSAHASNPNPSTDCDTWNRANQPGPGTQPSYMQSGAGDISNLHDVIFLAPNQPLPFYIHPNGNNAVVRDRGTTTDPSRVTYAQVAGGGQYTGDSHTPRAGEGGFEQARIYDSNTGTTVTFHNDLFGPVRESGTSLWQTSTDTCVSVDGQKVDTGRVAVDCNAVDTGLCAYH